MIASGYEKAGREWTNSLRPNGMKTVRAHLALAGLLGIRLDNRAPRPDNLTSLDAG